MTGRDGEYYGAEAVYDPETKKIVAKADSVSFDPEQLIEHELFHDRANGRPELVRKIADEIRKNFDEAEFNRIAERYLQTYRGAVDGSTETVEEEILADAYAGMNRFRDMNTAQYRETVQRAADSPRYIPPTNENAAALARRGVGDDGKTKLSFAGERAKTANVQALRDAQEMETIGADMESIRKATGWHKGRDGKWRFEIDDSSMRFDRGGERRGIDRSTAMREYNRSWNVLTGREMTEQQRSALRRYINEANSGSFDEALYRQLADEFGSAFEDYAAALEARKESRDYSEGKVLADYLRHDALFAAYPELRNAGITFEKLEEGTHGYYSAKENAIHLSNKLKNAPESTLIHEIQHIIQRIEGFSGGSSPEYWARKDYENGTSVSERLQKRYDDLLNGLSREDQNRYIRYTELERELGRLFLAEESSEDGRKYARLEAEQDKLYEELWQNEWFRKLLDLDRKIGNPSEEYYRLYRNTAGEIEARDSENRRGLTAEQRKETAPDYGNEDTVLANGSDIGFSEEKNGIGLNSTDEERYKVLKNTYLQPATVDYEKLSGINLDDYNTKKKSSVEKGIKRIAELLGVTGANLTNRNVNFDFQYSKKSIGTSLHHQLEYGGTYQDYVKAMSCFDELIKNAVPIETHTEKKLGTSRANQDLKQVYVLLGAFMDNRQLIPVEFEIKEFYSADAGLYLTVTLTKIDTGVLEETPANVSVGDTSPLLPMSKYSLQSIIENVNPADGRFLKYIPDNFLSEAQLEAKRAAFRKQNVEYAESGNIKFSLAASETVGKLTAANNLSEADLREGLNSGAITLSDDDREGEVSVIYRSGSEVNGTVPIGSVQQVILPRSSKLGTFRDLAEMGIDVTDYTASDEYGRERHVNKALGMEERQTRSEAMQTAAQRIEKERIESLSDADAPREKTEKQDERTEQIEEMRRSPNDVRRRIGGE